MFELLLTVITLLLTSELERMDTKLDYCADFLKLVSGMYCFSRFKFKAVTAYINSNLNRRYLKKVTGTHQLHLAPGTHEE